MAFSVFLILDYSFLVFEGFETTLSANSLDESPRNADHSTITIVSEKTASVTLLGAGLTSMNRNGAKLRQSGFKIVPFGESPISE